MAHNDYVRRDGQWGGNPVPVPRDMQRFDVAQYESVNGDGGGIYSPSSPIIVGGAGVVLSGPNAHTITGGVRTTNGGRLELGHNDWPTIAAPLSRIIVIPFERVLQDNGDAYQLDVSLDPVGVKFANVVNTPVQWSVPQRFFHHGSTILGVTLNFRIGQPHLAVPASRPSFTLYRFHQGRTALDSVATGVLPNPGTGSLYYAGGAGQAVAGTMTPANAGVDVGLYTWLLQLNDESGANAMSGNVYTSMTLTFGTINDLRFE